MKTHKQAFLTRYNPQETCERSLSLAISAAVGHNSLYCPNITAHDKKSARGAWAEFLKAKVSEYSTIQTVEKYEMDIEDLKKMMNDNFSSCFNSQIHPIYTTDPGFRISHSQKSLSVFFKHQWCMGKIGTPPQCPVDAIILRHAGMQYPETKWGYVNSLDEHRRKIALLNSAKNDALLTLAEWELRKFGIN